MRKGVVILSLLWMGSTYAQQGTIKVGAVVLPQNTWLLNKQDSDAGPELDYVVTWGFAGGLTVGYNFMDNLGVGLDVLYSRQGQKYKGEFPNAPEIKLTAQTTLNYLKLPIFLRFNSDPNSTVQFSFLLGPQANLLLSYKDKATIKGEGNSFDSEASGTTFTVNFTSPSEPPSRFDAKLTAPIYTSFSLAAALGLGVDIRLSEQLLLNVHFRGDYTFGDAENKKTEVLFNGESEKYWTNRQHKYDLFSDNPNPPSRPSTTPITGGVMVGLTYTIPIR
ncbi:MAG: porin family protein [Bacteroidia bacterium]